MGTRAATIQGVYIIWKQVSSIWSQIEDIKTWLEDDVIGPSNNKKIPK